MWKCLCSVVRGSEFYHDASLSGCLDSCALSGPAPVTASGRDRAQEVCKGQVFFFFFLYIGLHHFPLVPEAYSVVFTSYKRLGMASKAAGKTFPFLTDSAENKVHITFRFWSFSKLRFSRETILYLVENCLEVEGVAIKVSSMIQPDRFFLFHLQSQLQRSHAASR